MVSLHATSINHNFIKWAIGFLTQATLIQKQRNLSGAAKSERIRNESVSMIESIIQLYLEQLFNKDKKYDINKFPQLKVKLIDAMR